MASDFEWLGKKVTVTGGASFIGSHLVDALVERRAQVKVVDDLSSGKRANIEKYVKVGTVPLVTADLRDPEIALHAVAGRDIVFHLAADHGGRGYVATKFAECSTNFHLDGTVFNACVKGKVKKVVFASSGCVYPLGLQTDVKKRLLLKEDQVGPPFEPDGPYGLAKLVGEITLRNYARAGWLKAASCRFFTVIGPRMHPNHAVGAFLARAYARQDPFEIWGPDGTALRNWTAVQDIVDGLLLSAERLDRGEAVNLGTEETVSVQQAAELACKCFDHAPKFKYLPDMPVGPVNRVADASYAKRALGWEPKVKFAEALAQAGAWLMDSKTVEEVRAELGAKLLTR